MDHDLPTEFDLVIIGTGVIESILSAAASRIGKRVLHIDSKNYYGGFWASFNLDSIQKLENINQNVIELKENDSLGENECQFAIGNEDFNLTNFECHWFPEHEANGALEWNETSLLKQSRKFNIDLVPKLQFARGEFVELLISSNIARYSEYRSVSRVLTWLNNELVTVPCLRSDVFYNQNITIIEKRMLMKLLETLNENNQDSLALATNYEKKTFKEFLHDRKLTSTLIHCIYAISMSTDSTNCIEGLENTKRFLKSLGRFGRTPFLFSMYGSGEISQAFCRLSAVFGGIYALSQPLDSLIFDNHKFTGIVCGKQKITADLLIMGVEKAPPAFIKSTPTSFIARAIFITDKSIMASDDQHLTLLVYPPEMEKNSCVIIELGSLTGTTPKDLYLVHFVSKQIDSPQIDFKHIEENLFGGLSADKPRILWSCYFSIPDSNDIDLKTNVPSNVVLCPGPDLDLDYDNAVKKAKTIFNDLYPDEEFLPRAPDPEEIIIEGEELTEIT